MSTLADWTAGVADRLAPLVDRLAARVLAATVVRTDATGLKVLDPSRAAHIERGTIWAYVGDDRDVLFRYTPTAEGATGPWAFLAGRTGYVQADASATFDRLFTGQVARATEVGCWAHARRPLVDLADTDCRVAYPLQLIRRLYRIEHLADVRHLGPEARRALRQAQTAPVLETLQRWVAVTCASEPPSTALAKAAAYLQHHWIALSRFLDDGRLSCDNTLTERQIRDIALGRRNYLFAGSHEAAARAATLYSLTRTCARYPRPACAVLHRSPAARGHRSGCARGRPVAPPLARSAPGHRRPGRFHLTASSASGGRQGHAPRRSWEDRTLTMQKIGHQAVAKQRDSLDVGSGIGCWHSALLAATARRVGS